MNREGRGEEGRRGGGEEGRRGGGEREGREGEGRKEVTLAYNHKATISYLRGDTLMNEMGLLSPCLSLSRT